MAERNTRVVFLEGEREVVAHVLARGLRQLDAGPVLVAIEAVVHLLEPVGQPANAGLGKVKAQLRIAVQHAAEGKRAVTGILRLRRFPDFSEERRLRALPFAVRCKDCEEAREVAVQRERQLAQRRSAAGFMLDLNS